MGRRGFDYKEAQLVRYYAGRLVGGSFDERDLYSVFILLREHAPAKSPVRELGDFVAHRVRDRGAFLKFLEVHRAKIERLP